MAKWISYSGNALTEPNEVTGFNKLSSNNQKLFESFLRNYYQVWEYPEERQPIKVEFFKKDNYLKVIFNDTWLHVVDEKTWY